MARRIFITAAEVSGDLHASHLVRSLLACDPTLIIEGHGGPRMRAAGARIHHETTARAAMGVGAVGRVVEMLRLVRRTREMFRAHPPDLVICVDSPALNFHFARLAKEAAGRPIPVLYYVAPQLWAWREGRMKKLRKWVEKVACILPFEEAYFRGHGVDATFVGHPLFDEMHGRISAGEPAAAREVGDVPVVGLLAGSRKSEAAANFSRMVEVAEMIRGAFGNARFLLPTTVATHPVVTEELQRSSLPASACEVRIDGFDAMVPACDLVITVSGTATLHVAIHRTPMIVVYHGNKLMWNLLGRWLIKTRTYGLVNLLAADGSLASSGRVTPEMHIVPEHIPWYGPTDEVGRQAIGMLKNASERAAQRGRLSEMVARLDQPGASMRTARIAMKMMGSEC